MAGTCSTRFPSKPNQPNETKGVSHRGKGRLGGDLSTGAVGTNGGGRGRGLGVRAVGVGGSVGHGDEKLAILLPARHRARRPLVAHHLLFPLPSSPFFSDIKRYKFYVAFRARNLLLARTLRDTSHGY
ncbi:hypothetical protein BHE74_00031703 [Ensete ventricosum]|nr:hypothetical protein GW17_00026135 [Ensete ventricosum]RWW61242.1 hypothetical protein BHE74_00031703 [Ensete ventricosum]